MGKLIKLHILGDFSSSGPGFLGSASPREQEVLSLRKAIVSSSAFSIRGAAGVRLARLPRWAEGWKSSTASSPDALSLAQWELQRVSAGRGAQRCRPRAAAGGLCSIPSRAATPLQRQAGALSGDSCALGPAQPWRGATGSQSRLRTRA